MADGVNGDTPGDPIEPHQGPKRGPSPPPAGALPPAESGRRRGAPEGHRWARKRTFVLAAILATAGGLAALVLVAPDWRHPRPLSSRGWTPAAIPKIDVHVHLAPALADEILAVIGEQGIRIALNASGGVPTQGLEASVEAATRTTGAIRPYCNFPLTAVNEPGFEDFTRRLLEECKRLGAVGLKIPKSLGLGVLTEGSTPGSRELLHVDDPRLDVLFDTAADLGFPVLLHAGDPQAFFRPPTPDNERYDELSAHPGWSFYGEIPVREGSLGRWPSWEEIFEQFERRVARSSRTTILGAHFGNAPEDPDRVARMLDRYPNLVIDTAARVPEIGRRPPERLRAFFGRYSDRILFGSDLGWGPGGLTLGSSGEEPDSRDRLPFFFRTHWRYFETADRQFEHPTPIQGHWKIDGIGLPRDVLESVYWRNANRVFHLGVDLAAPAAPAAPGVRE